MQQIHDTKEHIATLKGSIDRFKNMGKRLGDRKEKIKMMMKQNSLFTVKHRFSAIINEEIPEKLKSHYEHIAKHERHLD